MRVTHTHLDVVVLAASHNDAQRFLLNLHFDEYLFVWLYFGCCGFLWLLLLLFGLYRSVKPVIRGNVWLNQTRLTLFLLLFRLALGTYRLLALECEQNHGHYALGTLQQSRCLKRCWLVLNPIGITTDLPHRSWTLGLHPD